MKMGVDVTTWSGSAFERESWKSSLDIRSISSKSPVSRAITFGSPVSSKKMSNYQLVRDQMDQMRICDKSRWGFDFFTETPLGSSKYDWKQKKGSSDSLNSSSSYSYIGCKKCNKSPSSKNNSYENLSKTTTTTTSSCGVGGGCK